MYVTTLGIVRNTKARCSSVRKILRNLSVRYLILCNVLMHLEMLIASRVYEKDVFMSVNHCMDLKQRLGSAEINLPQVFVHGHLLGVRLTRMLMLYSETKMFSLLRMLTLLRN